MASRRRSSGSPRCSGSADLVALLDRAPAPARPDRRRQYRGGVRPHAPREYGAPCCSRNVAQCSSRKCRSDPSVIAGVRGGATPHMRRYCLRRTAAAKARRPAPVGHPGTLSGADRRGLPASAAVSLGQGRDGLATADPAGVVPRWHSSAVGKNTGQRRQRHEGQRHHVEANSATGSIWQRRGRQSQLFARPCSTGAPRRRSSSDGIRVDSASNART